MTQTVALSAARIWREHPKELILAGAAAAACALALAGAAWSSPATGISLEADAPPAPPPLLGDTTGPDPSIALTARLPAARCRLRRRACRPALPPPGAREGLSARPFWGCSVFCFSAVAMAGGRFSGTALAERLGRDGAVRVGGLVSLAGVSTSFYAIKSFDVTGLKVQDTEIDMDGHMDVRAVSDAGFTLTRVFMHNGADCTTMSAAAKIEDSLCSIGPDTNGDGWADVDIESWRDTLPARLPAGLGVWKGVRYNFTALRSSSPLWRTDDANCCPTGGRADFAFAVRDGVLTVTDVQARPAG